MSVDTGSGLLQVPRLWDDGNIFFITGKVTRAMRRAGYDAEAITDFTVRIKTSESYDEALRVVMDVAEEADDE